MNFEVNMDELNAQARQARFDFLIIDAETALTMLDLAENTNSPENRDRRRLTAERPTAQFSNSSQSRA